MKMLDCETVESTYKSIEKIYAIDRSHINNFLRIDLDDYYKANSELYISPNKLILSLFDQQIGAKGEYERTYWFHLTRQPESTKYEEGILPLGKCIDSIWNYLYNLVMNEVSKSKWDNFRRDVETNNSGDWADMYHHKLKHPYLHGHYGVLVREIAFKPSEVHYNDYLKDPEIIRDICNCFKEKYNFNLMQKFKESTQSCIVKFFENSGERVHIGCALYYLYCKFQSRELSEFCFSDFDGKGNPVPTKQIEKITFSPSV